MTGKEAIDKANEIKGFLKLGRYTYDEARKLVAPLLKIAEKDAEQIAKKWGRKPPKFSITGFLR